VKNWQAEYDFTDANVADKDKAIDNWIAARKKVVTDEAEPKIYTDRTNPETYSSFYNCTAGAFDMPLKPSPSALKKIKPMMPMWRLATRSRSSVCELFEVKDMPSPVAADAPDG